MNSDIAGNATECAWNHSLTDGDLIPWIDIYLLEMETITISRFSELYSHKHELSLQIRVTVCSPN